MFLNFRTTALAVAGLLVVACALPQSNENDVSTEGAKLIGKVGPNCEAKSNVPGRSISKDSGCYPENAHSSAQLSQKETLAAGVAMTSIFMAATGNADAGVALLQSAAPLIDNPSEAAQSTDIDSGSCTPGPRCAEASEKQKAILSRWESELRGKGVGVQYGYAYCGAKTTSEALDICYVEFNKIGRSDCAAQIKNGYDAAIRSADQAIQFGRDVGVDARQTGPCAG
jgi:hypothetical protein